jgi:hypothetical protein
MVWEVLKIMLSFLFEFAGDGVNLLEEECRPDRSVV